MPRRTPHNRARCDVAAVAMHYEVFFFRKRVSTLEGLENVAIVGMFCTTTQTFVAVVVSMGQIATLHTISFVRTFLKLSTWHASHTWENWGGNGFSCLRLRCASQVWPGRTFS